MDVANTQDRVKRPKGWGARHTMAFLGFWAMCILYALRFNLSIAIVAMVKSDEFTRQQQQQQLRSAMDSSLSSYSEESSSSENDKAVLSASNASSKLEGTCEHLRKRIDKYVYDEAGFFSWMTDANDSSYSNDTPNQVQTPLQGEFNWTRGEQGNILGSFFWGHVLTQVPGGMLAQRYGPKWPLGLGILFTSLLTLLIPAAARMGIAYLMAVRVLQGLVGGVVWPAMHLALGKWAPPDERSKLVSAVYAGPQFGTAAATVLCGYMIDWGVMGGWPSAFYVLGGMSLIWFVFWCLLFFDTPGSHPRISTEELAYIETSIGEQSSGKQVPTPWKAIFTSLPLWAIMVAHVGEDWGLYTLLTELPTYMKTVLHFNIKENSWMSAVPQLIRWGFSILLTYLADMLIHKKILKVVTVRKLCNTIGHWGAAVALIAVSYLGCDPNAAVLLLTVAVGINGAVNGGCITNHVDIAPNHAGILMGITNTAANVCGVLAPALAGYLTNDSASIESWQKVFFISAAIYGVNNLFYLLFAQGTEQPWNRSKEDSCKQEPKHNYSRNIEAGNVVESDDAKGKENIVLWVSRTVIDEELDRRKSITH